MAKPMQLYLAHPFAARASVREWELKVEAETGLVLVNPFYDMDRPEVGEIDAGMRDKYNVDATDIVEGDLSLMRSCDGMIVVIADVKGSYGTVMELAYGQMWDMPTMLIVTNGEQKHPWLQYHANYIVTDFDAAARALVVFAQVITEIRNGD